MKSANDAALKGEVCDLRERHRGAIYRVAMPSFGNYQNLAGCSYNGKPAPLDAAFGSAGQCLS